MILERQVGKRILRLHRGDITQVTADAIVNAANEGLRGGGGVDGAIHRAAGPEIMVECRRLGHCPTGQAVATKAGRLSARAIIHTVAPVWRDGKHGEPEFLAAAYRNSLQLAAQLNLTTIAFPSLGTGAYGYPAERAAPIAVREASEHLLAETSICEVTFVLFSHQDLHVYAKALQGADLFETNDQSDVNRR